LDNPDSRKGGDRDPQKGARLIKKKKMKYEIGQTVTCKNAAPLPKKKIAPPVRVGASYVIKDIFVDSKGHQHIDIGLVSEYEYISSFETGEHLPNGDKIHWCHPSRF
jgi:hypothetical protein